MPKLFDLALARQGHPLVTRDGRNVLAFAFCEYASRPITFAAERYPTWLVAHADGKLYEGEDNTYDLMLADLPDVEETWWAVIYHRTGNLFQSEAEALRDWQGTNGIIQKVTIRRPGTWQPKEQK